MRQKRVVPIGVSLLQPSQHNGESFLIVSRQSCVARSHKRLFLCLRPERLESLTGEIQIRTPQILSGVSYKPVT